MEPGDYIKYLDENGRLYDVGQIESDLTVTRGQVWKLLWPAYKSKLDAAFEMRLGAGSFTDRVSRVLKGMGGEGE